MFFSIVAETVEQHMGPISFLSLLQSEPKDGMSFLLQVTMAIVQARAQSSQGQKYAGLTLSKAGE